MIDIRSVGWFDVYGFHGKVVGKRSEDPTMTYLTGGVVLTMMRSLLLIAFQSLLAIWVI
jgi:hypothetical protein